MEPDRQTRLFLLCTWVNAYLLLFGLEARADMGRDGWMLSLAVLVGLSAAFVVTARWLASNAVRSARVTQPDGTSSRVALVDASAAFTEYVRSRARALGISTQLSVRRIPGTWTAVEAFAVGNARRATVVVTSALQPLARSKDAKDRDAVRFLVDHELAHVGHGDPWMLYHALAVVLWVVALLPIKLAITASLADGSLATFYAGVFPRALIVDGDGPQLREVATSSNTIIAVICIYSIALSSVLAGLYLSIVRRRELWADRIAARSDVTTSLGAFDRLFPPTGGRSHFWHPSPMTRRRAIERALVAGEDDSAPHDRVRLVLLWLMTVLSFRFALGSSGRSGTVSELDSSHVTQVLTFLLVALLYVGISTVVQPSSKRWPTASERWRGAAALLCGALVALVASVGFQLAFWLLLEGDRQALLDSVYRDLVAIEIFERLCSAAALPVIVALASVGAAIGVRSLASRRKPDPSDTFHSGMATGFALGMGLTLALSLALQGPIADYEASKRQAFSDAVLGAVSARDDAGSEDRGRLHIRSFIDAKSIKPYMFPIQALVVFAGPYRVRVINDSRPGPGMPADIRRDLDAYFRAFDEARDAERENERPGRGDAGPR
jgi:Zn-dependent protease with chaperone function